jgi:hypothetical protein
LLGSHRKIIDAMRHKSWIIAGLVIPIILNFVMLELWLVKGSGNANFVFFQGLVMWIFLALGLIEFITALLTITSAKKES